MSQKNINKNINIGEAELEIMKAVWKAGEPIGSAEIGKAVEDKGWKRTTIATFLARLVEKGALSAQKRGKAQYYTPVLTAKEYKKSQVKNLIRNLFDGSAQNLIASLFEEETLSDNDIKELRAIFEDKEDRSHDR
ncbi:MAG: BlaI/MecI/CopY family transcriptional regulator [Oscillospiraceae bacterium]|nr:BlaI/MecI/CopY family transcriptional regulator [Oscillospiraceae bacterium]